MWTSVPFTIDFISIEFYFLLHIVLHPTGSLYNYRAAPTLQPNISVISLSVVREQCYNCCCDCLQVSPWKWAMIMFQCLCQLIRSTWRFIHHETSQYLKCYTFIFHIVLHQYINTIIHYDLIIHWIQWNLVNSNWVNSNSRYNSNSYCSPCRFTIFFIEQKQGKLEQGKFEYTR